nr:PD-(D/E)XK nuclease family protein [Exiguobacterium aurantiacum]
MVSSFLFRCYLFYSYFPENVPGHGHYSHNFHNSSISSTRSKCFASINMKFATRMSSPDYSIRTRTIDLLIDIFALNLMLLIENKFHCSESVGQLNYYFDYIHETFLTRNILPVYLTLSNDATSFES